MSSEPIAGDFDHPNQQLRRSVIIALPFAFALSTIAVVLRLVARRITGTRLYLDDYLILVALLFKYGCSIGVVILLWNGMGSHITMIPQKNLDVYFKIGWSNGFVYPLCVAFIKLSILASYKRLFAARSMSRAVNLVALVVILWAIIVSLVGTFLCLPVAKFWHRALPGRCLDATSFYYGQQIPNIVTDLILLLLPLKSVWALPISKTQRVLLSGVFLVGILTLAFDIVRLIAMIHVTQIGPDITYNQAPMAVWTCTEAAVGIIAACLSHLRPLFHLASPRRLVRRPSPDMRKRQLNPPPEEGFSTDDTLFDPWGTQHSGFTGHSVCVELGK
ncbi:putative integral membrane protein Pth11-like [Aspergillus saccharolyticus JOP 1030-1]|uniref:Integral membrane protein n=1 Tax=Aspergillus saccharolyticus JOP 1030-1 TaxID=1450539 RepID=A0A318ZC47_9EURO|nr:integral membrane protein [Aspergillus saccharolyticus JOP 1030-1]PYH42263.1 integral membrane protein [Aspergillus saccharolyticus JOP 1030-1]